MSKNIILFSEVFYPEPIAMSTIVEDMAMYLSKDNHVTVVTPKPCRPIGYNFPAEKNKNNWNFERIIVKSHIHPKSNFIGRAWESISFGRAMVKYLKDGDGVDIIYAAIHPLFAQYYLVKYCKKKNIPCSIHVEDIYPEPFRTRLPGILGKVMYKLFFPMDKYILNNASKAIAIGPKLRKYLIQTRNTEENRVEYVYNWQDESRFDVGSVEKQTNDVFTFMYVGSLSSAANLINVANCYAKANPQGCRFVFAGAGVLKETLMHIAQNNPLVNFEFWEAKASDVPLIQSKADVLVLPLKPGMALKAFPSKFPAYLYSKKPVLAFVEKESDVADCINQSGCGWIVDPKNEDGLSEMFSTIPVATNNEVLEKMGLGGYEYGIKHLTKKVNLEKICSIILGTAK